jgi:hypothetical protein
MCAARPVRYTAGSREKHLPSTTLLPASETDRAHSLRWEGNALPQALHYVYWPLRLRRGKTMHLPPMLANPHLYDYIHSLKFEADGTLEFVDGAGQMIHLRGHGRYEVRPIEDAKFEVAFTELVQVNPYGLERPTRAPGERIPANRYPKIRDLAPFTVICNRESGRFAFRQDVIWRVDDEEEWPCLL